MNSCVKWLFTNEWLCTNEWLKLIVCLVHSTMSIREVKNSLHTLVWDSNSDSISIRVASAFNLATTKTKEKVSEDHGY